MAKQSSVNLDITNNADGFDISGGTTVRKLGITGGDVTIAGSGSAVVTFPTTSTTIAGLGITQSFSALQSFSAGISASGATFSGNISAPNIVTSVNGATGPIINVARTTDTLAQFASTTSAQLASIISNETGGGGVLVFNTSPTITTSITTASTSFALVNTTATTLNLGGAATTLTMGGTSGTASIRNPTLTLGNTNNTIVTNIGTTNYITLQPYGNINLTPASSAFSVGGSQTTLVVNNGLDATGQVQISGGDLYLGTKTANGEDSESVNIIFEGATDNANDTTITVVDPTANRTITFPDASGTVALTSGLVSSLSGSTYISVSGSTGAVTITNTGVQTFNGLTGAVTGVTVGGTNVFTSLNTFNAGISAAGATLSGAVNILGGFTAGAGAGNCYMTFTPTSSGGLWLQNGGFQIGGSTSFLFFGGQGSFSYVPAVEKLNIYGHEDILQSGGYQGGKSALRIGVGPNQTAPILSAYVLADYAALPTNYTATGVVAGIDNIGRLFSTAGISAAGGVTFAGTLQGTTANFTGLVSSTIGFSGPGTNITGVVTSFNNQTGAVTGVTVGGTNVFTALNTFNAGISASGGITLNGYLTGSTGFLFGPTSAFLQFVPKTTVNVGGLHLINGLFQVGQGSLGHGAGFLNVDGNSERMIFNGRTEMYVNQDYQSTVSAYSIAIGISQSADPIRIAKQTTINSIDATKLIAGCNPNGVWYGSGISAAGGTFSNNIRVNSAFLGRTGTNYAFGVGSGFDTLTTGIDNIFVGGNAGSGITSTTDNVAIGSNALYLSKQTGCIGVGTNAGRSNTKDNTIAIGSGAMQNNTGLYTVGIGTDAGKNNSANTIVAIGFAALTNNAGGGNMGIGPFALYGNTNSSASQNCALGNNALYLNSGARNVSVGNDTLVGGGAYVGQSGSRNSVIGYNAGFNNSSGSNNVFIGNQAGFENSSGNNNVFIGSGACGSTSGTTTREIVIGSNAVGLGSNTTVIGATSATSATIYGLLNTSSGISTSGITFSDQTYQQSKTPDFLLFSLGII
jgi:hypothetical protein